MDERRRSRKTARGEAPGPTAISARAARAPAPARSAPARAALRAAPEVVPAPVRRGSTPKVVAVGKPGARAKEKSGDETPAAEAPRKTRTRAARGVSAKEMGARQRE